MILFLKTDTLLLVYGYKYIFINVDFDLFGGSRCVVLGDDLVTDSNPC